MKNFSANLSGRQVLQEDLDHEEVALCDSWGEWLGMCFENCKLEKSDVEALASVFIEDCHYGF